MGKKWTIKPSSYEPGVIPITRVGYNKMKARFRELVEVLRPPVAHGVGVAAAEGDRSENAEYIYGKKRLREIDREIYRLEKRLQQCHVIEDAEFPKDYIGFGSTVELCDDQNKQRIVQLVGADEIDVKNGKISIDSPLARILLRKKSGEFVTFHPPKGEIEYEVVAIR